MQGRRPLHHDRAPQRGRGAGDSESDVGVCLSGSAVVEMGELGIHSGAGTSL